MVPGPAEGDPRAQSASFDVRLFKDPGAGESGGAAPSPSPGTPGEGARRAGEGLFPSCRDLRIRPLIRPDGHLLPAYREKATARPSPVSPAPRAEKQRNIKTGVSGSLSS